MKLKPLTITVFSAFLLFSCSHSTTEQTMFFTEQSDGSVVITGSGNGVYTFPSSKNGKKLYLTRSNYGTEDLQENYKSPDSRSATSTDNEGIVSLPVIDSGDYYDIPYHPPFFEPEINESTQLNRSIEVYSEEASEEYTIDQTETFYVYENSGFDTRQATLKGKNDKCLVWISNETNTENLNYDINKILNSFTAIQPQELNLFGSNTYNNKSIYIDSEANPKTHILIYDINHDYNSENPPTGGTFGYFHSVHFYKKGVFSNSNAKQMIFVDSYFLSNEYIDGKKSKHGYSTITHEYQHLLNYINKCIKHNAGYSTWFTEMLSTLSEDILQKDQPGSIGMQDKDSSKSRLYTYNKGSYMGFRNWTKEVSQFSYANAYTFGAFLLRNYGGVKLIEEIAQNEYTNEEAITHALKALGYNETFRSVLQKYPEIQLLNASNRVTLNKGNSNDVLHGKTYNYTAINLANYASTLNKSDYGDPSIYHSNNKISITENSTNFTINGPLILNGRYYLKLPQSGTYCSYEGIATTNRMYRIYNKNEKVDMKFIFVD